MNALTELLPSKVCSLFSDASVPCNRSSILSRGHERYWLVCHEENKRHVEVSSEASVEWLWCEAHVAVGRTSERRGRSEVRGPRSLRARHRVVSADRRRKRRRRLTAVRQAGTATCRLAASHQSAAARTGTRSTVVDERIGARVAVRHAVPDDAEHLVDGAVRRVKAEVSGQRLDVDRQPRDAEHDHDDDD